MPTPETPSAPLAITLFGPMQVLIDGHPLPHLRSRKGIWILALLALRHDRPVEREWLAAAFWPDMETHQAFANLRPILSELRSGLGSQKERLLSPDRHTLRLDLTDASVDVLAFDAAIKRGRPSDLERAVALYRGPMLEGYTEEWVFQERNIREHHCLQALDELGNSALMVGDYGKAIGCYRRMVSIDPWWESARRSWMEALSRSGDTNAALQVYREFVELLRSDPRAVPDKQTTALYQRLRMEAHRRGSSPHTAVTERAAVPKVAGYLPHPLTDLVGREDERLEVAARLHRSRLVTLTGSGGIGKTRLAIEIAADATQEYADGVWLVALEALAEGGLVAGQIATVLGVRETPGRNMLQNLTDHLQKRRLLLVLDNCEHLLQGSAHVVGHLLQSCPHVSILATSREALGITGETAWAVPALAVPPPDHLPQGQATLQRVLMGYESVQLFVERAQSVQKDFTLSGENAGAVAQICAQLEGIPLAIELAARRVRAMNAAQIAIRLHDHLNLLTDGSRTAMSRQQTLRATLDWSYALLPERERRLLSRLSVFAGGWTLEAAEQVCAGTEIQSWQVLPLLTSLVDKSLVLFAIQKPNADSRYRLLETVRQYAAERLKASGETEQIKHRHRDWCVCLAEQAEPELRSHEQEKWLSRLASDHENMRAALDWGERSAQTPEASLRLAGALVRFWDIRGHYSEGRAYLDRILEMATSRSPSTAQPKALHGAGDFARTQSDYAMARSRYEECVRISKALHDKQGTAEGLNSLGIMESGTGNYTEARLLHEESLALHREMGESHGIASSLNNLGNIHFKQGDYNSAWALYEKSLRIRRELGDLRSIAISLNNLGIVASHRSDLLSARSLHEESLQIRRELGDKRGVAYSLSHLGKIASAGGDYDLANTLGEESLQIRQELGDRYGISLSLIDLGNVAVHQEKYDLAWTFYEESLFIQKELGDRHGIALTLGNMGHILLEQGDLAAARPLYEESLRVRTELGDRYGIAITLIGLGNLACAQSDYARAQGLLLESLRLLREMRDLEGVADNLTELAAVMLSQSDLQAAACLWGAAHKLRENTGTPMPLGEHERYDRQVAQARAALGEGAFAICWERGCAMKWEQAVEYALAETDRGTFLIRGRLS